MLLIDSGNSSIKCRLLQSGIATDRVFDRYRANGLEDFGAYLKTLDVADIYVASVASDEVQLQLLHQLSTHSIAQLKILETLPALDGIKNAYQDYRQLGVDRWLALLGASETCASDSIVIDAGSAITIDLLSKRLGHLGGAILPGFHCDRQRFQGMFPNIDFSTLKTSGHQQPGKSTIQCLHPQESPANSNSLRRFIEQWRNYLSAPVEILLCGQDAALAAASFDEITYRIVPDLVFTGMLKQIECLG